MMTLSSLFDEVRDKDIDDPKCMEKIFEYMSQLEEEAEDYMQLLAFRLEDVSITWDRPWYQEQPSVTTVVVDDGTHESTFLTCKLTVEERKRIERNWRKFVKRFDVPDRLELYTRWKHKPGTTKRYGPEAHARHFVAAYLSRGLQSTIPRVYHHVVTHYNNPTRGPYSQDEKKVIDICFNYDPHTAPKILSTVLSRDIRAFYNRCNFILKGKPDKKRINWNLTLATKFLHLLMEYTEVVKLKRLKNMKIGINIWRQLADNFGTQPEYLRHFWYTTLHCQLFCKCDVTLRRIRRRVFKILKRSPYEIWSHISWNDVVAELPDGFTYQFVYWITVRVFRAERLHTKLEMPEIVRIGLEKTNNKSYGNKRLKTLKLNKEGNLEVIRYDNKL